jgi:hypothetical protein
MKTNNMRHFIEKIIPARDLVEGVDYEISSFFVYDLEEHELYTIGDYYGLDASSLLCSIKNGSSVKADITNEITSKTGLIPNGLCSTPFPENPFASFYQFTSPIDYDTAISLGFGIVKMLKPNMENELFLYNYRSLIEDEDDMIADQLEEIGRLKCYLQLTESGKFRDPTLADFLEEYEDELYSSLLVNPYKVIQRIFMSLDRYKGELVVLPRK